MTESQVRKRATLFFRELGTADAAAGLPTRESEDLLRPWILARFDVRGDLEAAVAARERAKPNE
jgi:hypothetical protein